MARAGPLPAASPFSTVSLPGMIRSALVAVVAVLAFAALAPAARAQSNAEVRRVVLVNGDVYVGVVEDEAADPIVLVTRDGIRREFRRDQVDVIAPLIRGRFFRTDPVGTGLVVAPTARTQGAGAVRVGVTGFVPTVNVGVSDRVDLTGAGVVSFGSEGGGFIPLVGLKAAVVDREGMSVALGVSAAALLGSSYESYECGEFDCTVTERSDDGFLAVPYGVVTMGDETRAFTAGVAGFIGGVDNEVNLADGVAVWIGGETQLNNGVKLIGEALTAVGSGDSGVVLLPGVRLFGDSFAFDIVGFITIGDYTGDDGLDLYGFAPIPLRLSYTF